MQCPLCHKDVPWAGNLFRPFCSERCKLIDLDNWLSGRYCISASVENRDKSRPAAEMEQDGKRRRG